MSIYGLILSSAFPVHSAGPGIIIKWLSLCVCLAVLNSIQALSLGCGTINYLIAHKDSETGEGGRGLQAPVTTRSTPKMVTMGSLDMQWPTLAHWRRIHKLLLGPALTSFATCSHTNRSIYKYIHSEIPHIMSLCAHRGHTDAFDIRFDVNRIPIEKYSTVAQKEKDRTSDDNSYCIYGPSRLVRQNVSSE